MELVAGTVVVRRRDGRRGVVEGVDEQGCVVARFKADPEGGVLLSPWGEYPDGVSVGHVKPEFVGRLWRVVG